jgi:acyl-coenzyme A synthetase/AMP-(fatty) acid ligase
VTGAGDDPALCARVIEHCRASLAKFKVPRDVIVIPELPRISIGKVAKAQLRQRFKEKA